MAGRFSFTGPFAVFLLASCSFDTSGFKASGAGGTPGTGGNASTVTSGVTTATNATSSNGTTNTATATTNATTTNASTTTNTSTATTSASTTSASTTTVATTVSTVASTVTTTVTTGGPLDLPFCETGSPPHVVSDNFNLMTFSAEWTPVNAADNGMVAVLSKQGMSDATLFLKSTTNISTDCALTVDLVEANNGEQRFRLNTSPTMTWQRIRYANQVLSFANATDSPQINVPMTLAFVSHGGQLYAAYKSNGAWTRFDHSVPLTATTTGVYVGMTQEAGGNGDNSSWDNFNLTKLSLMDIGL